MQKYAEWSDERCVRQMLVLVTASVLVGDSVSCRNHDNVCNGNRGVTTA